MQTSSLHPAVFCNYVDGRPDNTPKVLDISRNYDGSCNWAVCFSDVVVALLCCLCHFKSLRVKSFWLLIKIYASNPSKLSSYELRLTDGTDSVAVKKTFTIESQGDQSCCWMVSVRWSFVMILIFANNYNCNIIRMRSLNFPGYLCCSRVLLIFPTALGLDAGSGLAEWSLHCRPSLHRAMWLWIAICEPYYSWHFIFQYRRTKGQAVSNIRQIMS